MKIVTKNYNTYDCKFVKFDSEIEGHEGQVEIITWDDDEPVIFEDVSNISYVSIS